MPRHKYDGTWRYFENPQGGPDVYTQGENMELSIPAEDGVVNEASSSHNGERVSGNARNSGVTLFRRRTGNTRTFHGVTMIEVPLSSGGVFAVIKGTFTDAGGKDKDANEVTQNQGDWIITKP